MALALWTDPCAAFAAGQRYALLIGINEPQSVSVTSLRYAENDVDALAARLPLVGYRQPKVLKGQNARRGEILRELRWMAAHVGAEDTFLLYFAGHGVRGDNGATYWLTYSAELSVLDNEGIRLEHLMDYVRDIKAGQKIVMLDHCYSGDIVEQVASDAASTNGLDGTASGAARAPGQSATLLMRGASFIGTVSALGSRATGLAILAAARGPAFELDKEKHGAFTQALLESISSRKVAGGENLKLVQLAEHIKKRVAELTKQQPTEIVTAQNVADWVVAVGLPPDSADGAKKSVEGWQKKLDEWQSEKGWIVLDTKITARDVLKQWIKSLEPGGAALDARAQTALAIIKNHVELPKGISLGKEEEYAKDLEECLNRVYQ